MEKEVITQKQGISMMFMFIIGSTMVIGVGADAKNDVWISILVAMAMAVPMLFVYARIVKLFPGVDFWEILEKVFGKILAKIISVMFIWYSLHLGALVIRNFSEFIQIVSIPETPQFIIVIFIGALSIYIVRSGVEIIGRWSAFVAPMIALNIVLLFVLATTQMNPENIKPILNHGLKPVMISATSVFSFPFAETVLLLPLLTSLNKKGSPYKVYYLGLIIGGILILSGAIRNVLTLGVELAQTLYFPSYASVSLINIGNFLQRVELVVSINFLLSGLVKVSVCLYSTSRGAAKLLNLKNYRKIVAPAALIMMTLSCIIYKNAMDMFEWATEIYKFYAIPFQIILPLIILITAEIKTRTMRNKKTA